MTCHEVYSTAMYEVWAHFGSVDLGKRSDERQLITMLAKNTMHRKEDVLRRTPSYTTVTR
jgi:hypothetical protein